MKLTYLYKIYIAAGLFLVVAGILFSYAFPWAHGINAALAERIGKKGIEYKAIEAEQRSYESGKKDLENLENLDNKPTDLFSQDVRLVREIKTLEELATREELKMTLQISGTVAEAKKVPQSTSNIFLIPYAMNVVGTYPAIMRFMESVEHAPFVTHVTAVSMTAVSDSEVRVILNGNFFIKK
jgi:hypothetical protein